MTPRSTLLEWAKGDAALVTRLWQFHKDDFHADEVLSLVAEYKSGFPDEPEPRLICEARVDFLSRLLRRRPEAFLEWLREFNAAAEDIVADRKLPSARLPRTEAGRRLWDEVRGK